MPATHDDFEKRIISLANSAKHALWSAGSSVPSDQTLIRAALAFESMRAILGEIPGDRRSLCVTVLAIQFHPGADGGPEIRDRLLVAQLCDPGAQMEAAVANNARLLADCS